MNNPPDRFRAGELVRTSKPAARVAADLAGRGFAVGKVDAHDKSQLLAGIGTALRFPSWYGRNLDALWDCLTDLTDRTALVWTGWEDLAVGHPGDWAAVLAVLTDRVRLQPAFVVVLAPSPGQAAATDSGDL